MIVQDRSLRKPTGGRYKDVRAKKLSMKGHKPALTTISATRSRTYRTRGGARKKGLLNAEKCNLFDPKAKKYALVKIKTVKESGANRNFVRRNIMTKGTIIETEKGLAVITNRPGQEGTINAVLQAK